MVVGIHGYAAAVPAMAENDSNAPVIHSTARARSGRCALLGNGFALTTDGVKSAESKCRRMGGHNGRKAIERHMEGLLFAQRSIPVC
jgi:hypothetical protein